MSRAEDLLALLDRAEDEIADMGDAACGLNSLPVSASHRSPHGRKLSSGPGRCGVGASVGCGLTGCEYGAHYHVDGASIKIAPRQTFVRKPMRVRIDLD